MRPALLLCSYLLLTCPAAADDIQKARYVRPSAQQFATECDFTLQRNKTGSNIVSVTQRGATKLTVTAQYDDADNLTAAAAVLSMNDQKKTATVRVAAGKAKVQRDGQAAQEFDVPKGVIVTSAPDWTDTFLLCRRYDRAKGGKQSFPGLWMHPVEPSQRLTFAIERHGADVIEHAGKKATLDRFTIRLRGNSSYAAWADANGTMIKLVPMPFQEKAMNWLVLEGYEKSAAALRP